MLCSSHNVRFNGCHRHPMLFWPKIEPLKSSSILAENNIGMSMAAPKSDSQTTKQHCFSKKGWSQHSETGLKVHGLSHAIKLP